MTSSAHARFRAQSRFGSLDGLRAISVTAVVWYHTGGGMVDHNWIQGQQGVTLFFAISGFLITTLLLREHEQHGAIDLRAFYVRRSLRIFPLYFAVLLAYVVLVFLLERHSDVGRQFFSNLKYFATYTSNWFVPLDGRTIFYFSWSLAAEEQFYVIWPPLLKRLGTPRRALAVSATVVVTIALLEWALPWFVGRTAAEPVQTFLRSVPLAIVAGVVGALLLHDPRCFDRLWPWLGGSRWHVLFWLLVALAGTYGPVPWAVSHLVLALLVVACCVREDHVLAAALRLRPVAYVGTISYGVYLLHMLCKNFIVKAAGIAGVALGPAATFVTTMLLAVVVAGLSFKHFESRFLRLKRPFERSARPGLRSA